MQPPDWKFFETIQKKIRITRIDTKGRYVDVFDLDKGVPLCLSAGNKIDLGKIKKAKIYLATINLFKAELTPELERHAFESALSDLIRLKALQTMKASGEKLTMYELVALKH
jgi:hypothetical protein